MKTNYLFLLAVLLLTLNACDKERKGTSYVYVVNENGESISVIDCSSLERIKNIFISDSTVSMVMPHNVQVAPNGKSVWVTVMGMTHDDQEQLVVIDPETNEMVRRIYLGEELHLAHVVFDDASENAFATAYEGNKVFQVSTSTYEVVRTFELDTANGGPHGLRYYDGKLYVAGMYGNNLTIIDISSGDISYTALGGLAVQTAVTPNGKYAFVSLYDTKEVIRYDIKSQEITRIALPSESQGPIQLYPTPDNKYIYVCDQGGLMGRPTSNKVYKIDTKEASVVGTITVGNAPHGVVVSANGKRVYLTNRDDQTVSVIETADDTVIETIAVGAEPNGISYRYEEGGMP